MEEEISEEELKKLPFMSFNLDLEERADDLLQRLNIEEKFRLCSGTERLFNILIGNSSRGIRLQAQVEYISSK
ncbi:MAG: hypothetical protein ACFE8M_09915 [Candidatus Hermodarchaeota archaeon]